MSEYITIRREDVRNLAGMAVLISFPCASVSEVWAPVQDRIEQAILAAAVAPGGRRDATAAMACCVKDTPVSPKPTSNPSDCDCEFEHASSRSCRSLAPSRGSVSESERTFPAPSAPHRCSDGDCTTENCEIHRQWVKRLGEDEIGVTSAQRDIDEPAAPKVEPLTFDAYSVVSKSRAMRWHRGGLDEWSVTDWACALAGEVGELCNAIKKYRRVEDQIFGHDGDTPQPRDVENAVRAITKEIGDSYAYLDLLCQRFGLRMQDCVRETFNKISEREGFPERI